MILTCCCTNFEGTNWLQLFVVPNSETRFWKFWGAVARHNCNHISSISITEHTLLIVSLKLWTKDYKTHDDGSATVREGGERGAGPGHPRQGSIQRVKLQKWKCCNKVFFLFCKAPNTSCMDLVFRNLSFLSALVFSYSNASNSHILQCQGPIF